MKVAFGSDERTALTDAVRADLDARGHDVVAIGPDEFEVSAARLREIAAAAGRDPEAIQITVWPGSHDRTSEHDVNYVRRFVAAGARRLLITPQVSPKHGFGSFREQVDRYREGVLDEL